MTHHSGLLAMALAPGLCQEKPLYTCQILGQKEPLSGPGAIHRINRRGDWVSSAISGQPAVSIGGVLFRLGKTTPLGVPQTGHEIYPADVEAARNGPLFHNWATQDIADDGSIVGVCSFEGDRQWYTGKLGNLKLVSITGLSPNSAPHGSMINARGDVIVNAIVEYSRGTGRAVRITPNGQEYLAYRAAGAIGTFAFDLSETGDVCGLLQFPGQATRPAVWTAKGELIELETLPEWTSCEPSAILNKDMVSGIASSKTKEGIGVLWVSGKPQVLEPPQGTRFYDLWPTADGHILATLLRGKSLGVFIQQEGKWVSLLDVSSGWPKGAALTQITDDASDGSVLVTGSWSGKRTFFLFRPLKDDK